MQLRLDKILTDTGRWSRKESREVIRAGRVTVGGTVVRRPEQKADPQAEEIAVDGAPLGWSAHSYLMLHKPAGVLTATEDRSAPTVLDLVPAGLRRPGLAPVGRLDKDTTGLLLLTDDGALAHALLSPRRHVDKVYLARIEGTVREEDCAAFRAGLTLGDGTKCLPAELEGLGPGCCRVTVREGKYHQVRRMLALRGLPVRALSRISFGPLRLDGALAPGQVRALTAAEIDALRRET
ncbi:MAG TPA: rRNA pseudouridine synthase [Candidatus Onthomonas avicola]|nr:rRNA pseudouridine synthase [Candidatus Onthomonas avicola]